MLALLGSGVQAQSHLAALSSIRAVRRGSSLEPHARTRGEIRAEARRRGDGGEAAVRGADVIVVATSSQEPVLEGAWLKAGAHVNAVGANRPTWRELDDDAMRNTLVVDSREAVLQESGDVILSGAKIYAEIGEIFAGTKRAAAGETTIFKSVGIAAEDLAAARLVYDAATKSNSERL